MFAKRTLVALALGPLVFAAVSPPAGAQTLSYPNFSSTAGLQLNGTATRNGSVLALTPATFNQSGSAFSTTTIPLSGNASFSTVFEFQILDRGRLGNGADGLTFTVQPNASNVGGAGGGIGYARIDHSMAVEFDTFDNGEQGDSNHVAIDLNGDVSNSAATTGLPTPDFDNGQPW